MRANPPIIVTPREIAPAISMRVSFASSIFMRALSTEGVRPTLNRIGRPDLNHNMWKSLTQMGLKLAKLLDHAIDPLKGDIYRLNFGVRRDQNRVTGQPVSELD
jgi:hypothetical protein